MAEYEFNTRRPPLLLDFPDPNAIDPLLLRNDKGFSAWAESMDVRTGDLILAFQHTDIAYTATRTLRWVPTEGPVHYAGDLEVQLKTRKGYSRTEKESIERSLSIEVGGAVPLAGLKADVKAGLKMNNELSQTWTEEQETTSKFTYKANITYVGWTLFDSVFFTKETAVVDRIGDPPHYLPAPVKNEAYVFNVVLAQYQDGLPDPTKIAFANADKNLLKLVAAANRVSLTG